MRQVCNVAFATIAAQLDGEQRREFLEDLSGDEDWEAQADALYASLEARGYGKG